MVAVFESFLEMTTALVFGDHVIVIKDSLFRHKLWLTVMIARKRAETVGKAQVIATWLVKGRSLNVLTLSAGHRWNSVLFDLPFHNGSLP